ncbi:MAG: transporter [Devosia sp.]|uniref:MFS transporter n=1 Tax=Devosia sp. TaxID=1871048 RepID=UPI0026237D3E|nr:MFS transporter [Devosia sp.]MDB5588872.1 transporter [Devosia sp.]
MKAQPSVHTIALIVAGALFMQMLDATIIVTALPSMGQSFGVEPLSMSIGITVYMLTVAILIPAAGWLADRVGARSVFLGAIVVFTLGSILCGLAQTLPQFVAARAIQGAGGAFMVPVGQIIVLRLAHRSELVRAISLLTWPALFAPVIGPTIGGFITTYFSWRWTFLINIPLGLCSLALAAWFIPDDGYRSKTPLDWRGLVMTSLGLGLLLAGLDGLVHHAANMAFTIAMVIGGAVLAGLAALHMRRAKHPLLDFSTMRVPTFALSNLLAGSYYRIALNTMPFLLPLLFQLGFGLDPFQAGSLMVAYFAGNLAVRLITTPVLERFGFRQAMVVNGILSAVAIALCIALRADTPVYLVIALMVFGGATRSMQYTALNVLAFIDISPEQRSSASTLSTMLMQITILLGVVVGSLSLSFFQAVRGANGLDTIDFQLSFAVLAVLTLVSALQMRALPASVGQTQTPIGQPPAGSYPEA